MATGFILGIGDRLYDVSAEPERLLVSSLRGRAEASGRAGGDGRRIVRLAPRGEASIVPGTVDYGAAEALLADAGFWSGLEPGDAARLAGVAAKIAGELSAGGPGAQALAGAWAVELVVLALRMGERRRPGVRPWSAPDGVWSIDDAIRHIETNFADAFSLDWFVGKCAMNVTDFSRRFRERAACPLFEYINRQRIKRACSLLKSSDLSIIEIAGTVGYNNLSFFNRYFLRIVGVSPRAWRSGSSSVSAR